MKQVRFLSKHVILLVSFTLFTYLVGKPATITAATVQPAMMIANHNVVHLAHPYGGDQMSLSFQDGLSPDASYAGTRDTTLSEEAANTNYGSATTCLADGDDPSGSGNDKSVLLKWDVSAITDGETVHSATITLNITDETNGPYALHEINQNWVESEATWQAYSLTGNWQTSGARGTMDHGTTVLGTINSTGTGQYNLNLNTAGVALVQSWVDNPSSNYGVILANSSTTNGSDFDCREAATTQNRPKLTVTYGGTPPVDLLDWIWSGAVTMESAKVNAKLKSSSNNVRLIVSQNMDFYNPVYSATAVADAANNDTVSLTVNGLQANTQYYYAVEADGQVDTNKQGKFHTFADGPFSYMFAYTGDAIQGANGPVYDTISAENPLFFVNPGDFMYSNIGTNDINLFRSAFHDSLTATKQQELYRNVPIAYMWDDHDYGPNDSDRNSPSREASRLVYQETVPHYALQDDPADHPTCGYSDPAACRTINQAFTVGRAYFIMTDLRSERDPKSQSDDSNKDMMGSVQKAWFKEQLLYANGRYPLIFWLSSVPYIEAQTAGSDRWGGYVTERAEIANFIKENSIKNVVIISADAHMLALDDGTNSDYAAGGGAAMPVLHASALNQQGSVKGGPYSHGTYPSPSPNDGQYATITVTDSGGSQICIEYTGKRLPNGATTTTTLLNWSRCFEVLATAVAPHLTITANNSDDDAVHWDDHPANCTYEIYRDFSPYLNPDLLSPVTTITSPTPGNMPFAGDLGDPNQNHFYRLRAVSCHSASTADSNEVGEFDFAIISGSAAN